MLCQTVEGAMRRREFIFLVSGAVTMWSMRARAQQPERIKLIGALQGVPLDDQQGKIRFAAFQQELQQFGWTVGRNVRLEHRGSGGNAESMRQQAVELAALAPDVIFTTGTQATEQTIQATHTVPIVFAVVADPVGAGMVARLSRPGGNATGFMQFEYSLSGKWLELLKQIAPSVNRAAILRDPTATSGIGQFAVIQSVAPSMGIEVSPINTNDATTEIERAISDFAREPNGGLISTASSSGLVRSELIVSLAARYKLPTVHFSRDQVTSGGLISYGADFTDLYRRAASYVDRVLKGEKPAEMPVQAPNKYALVINLKTAKALGLTVPPTLLARADEVIE
jgi:putative tryptophan/tyrosine transport system substrate-binding protein